ncbi:MAG: glyoxalase family protein [Rhodobacteraceae bacterium HLUCCA08]|nr:MAG: glyoxalase family protein [Rhodobacteraceae bacterium HLUCCA08]
MLHQIKGIHHVTALASSPRANNLFFTETLGLRRVKKTVNFDAPDVYHLYYGDALGTPGTAMTYFPFPNATRGRPGTGEVGETVFSVPGGSLPAWRARLDAAGVAKLAQDSRFGDDRLTFVGPDGERLALVVHDDPRMPWTDTVAPDTAIRGFHSATLTLADVGPMAELLAFMGYDAVARNGTLHRFALPGSGNQARTIDLDLRPDLPRADQGAGSVHHIAFAVENRARQLEVREALADAGYRVTPPIDRDYFMAIYFRTPGGVLFEIATDEPGFDRDEDRAHLGEALKLPSQHEHLRRKLERVLEPLD